MDSSTWQRYTGGYVSPAAYYAEHTADLEGALRHDLAQLWGNHPTECMTADEIAAVAAEIAGWLESKFAD